MSISIYQVLMKVALSVSAYDVKRLKLLYRMTVSQYLQLDASLRFFKSVHKKSQPHLVGSDHYFLPLGMF